MRFPVAVVLLLALYAAPSNGQASRGAPPPPDTRTTPRPQPQGQSRLPVVSPIELEDQWTTALVRRDARTFDRLLAPGFVYTEDASLMNRNDVIKSVSGPDRVEWARNEGMRVHDFGDVQVITGILHLKGKGKQGSFDKRYQFTDTWQRRNGRWQIIAAQDYLIRR
ncbi:MAG: nuclear transport factor 2 family protein [Gemmatimonadales bacterium]